MTATQARAVIDYIDEHKLMINAAEVGAYLRAKLEEMQAKHPIIGEVRGMGLLVGVDRRRYTDCGRCARFGNKPYDPQAH